MEAINSFIDIFLHLDQHLGAVIQYYGTWTYLILFLIIFCETGLVVTPILPGDSLLFAAGAFAATGALDASRLFGLLIIAAVAGDSVNYWAGYFLGPKVFHKENVRFLNREYLKRAHNFYEKYGAETIIVARFLPIIRTFAPFVAGIGRMRYLRFLSYSILGSTAWISLFVYGGYYFGNIPVVRKNFSLVIVAIVFISILPALIQLLRQRNRAT